MAELRSNDQDQGGRIGGGGYLFQRADWQVGDLPVDVDQLLENPLGRNDRVGHEQRHGHGADTSGHRRDVGGSGRRGLEVDVADQPVA